MQTQSAQLTAARARIALLERELQALRSTTPSPVLSDNNNNTPQSPLKPARPLLKPRPAVMTRRASAAAAAMLHQPSSPSSSPLPNKFPLDDTLSAGLSEHSSSRRPPSSPSCDHHSSSPLEKHDPANKSPQSHSQIDPIIEALTPEMTSSPAPDHIKIISTPKFLSSPVVPTPDLPVLVKEKHIANITAAAPTTSVAPTPVAATVPVPSPPVSPKSPQEKPPTSSNRRRPPPLPVVKSSTKKERYNLVAKCTEPKPGQTRYWTDEEHERFLEAVAEYGEKAYVAISNYVETRTPKQVRTHAQKFQMKMARLAKQSIEAGQPIQMPAGMRPIVQLPPDAKPLVLTIPPNHAAAPVAANQCPAPGAPSPVPLVVVSQPSQQTPARKAHSSKCPSGLKDDEKNSGVDTSSVASDESSSAHTDPYMNYIGGTADSKVEMDLENSFAAKLSQTLHDSSVAADSRDGDFLMSDGGSNDSMSMGDDDDLEDLEKLEDGDLSLAPFSNTSDNWLLPDAPTSSV